MGKIEFFIPKDEQIPTELRLVCGDAHIIYRELPAGFAYEFKVYHPGASEPEDSRNDIELVKEIADIMCRQSEDHGSRWVVRRIECVESAKYEYEANTFSVYFRMRDSY